MRPIATLAIVLALWTAASAAQADPYAAAWQRIAEFARSRMAAQGTPGLALAVTDRDRLLHVGTFGYADVTARKPVTPETLFQIGSISKSFTSIALLQLHDEGRFDPQAPITKYLPWFSVKSTFEPITGHHLMSHTSGLPRDRDDVPSSMYQAYGVREREVGYAPGTHYAYSNVGYQVLGYALETIAARDYPVVIEERLLRPLGMHASAAQFTHETRPKLAIGYVRQFDDRPSHTSHALVPATWLEYAAGDGSIVSTPADMSAYARFLLNRGAGPDGRRLLSDRSFDLLTQKAIGSGRDQWYGYGLGTRTRDGRTTIEHSGGMVGYSSMLVVEPGTGFGAVAMVNGPGDSGAVVRFALDVLRAASRGEELPKVPPVPDPLVIDNARDYVGRYTGAGGTSLSIRADGSRLMLDMGQSAVALERRSADTFFVHHPEYDRFLLEFERNGGKVVAAHHGASWYAGEAFRGDRTVSHPKEWDAYVGHFRTTHAWFNNFRVIARRGALYLVSPGGGETQLEPLGPGLFKEEGTSSERIRFDSLVNGKALRVNLSGVDYYRVFTR